MSTGLKPYPAYKDSGVEWLGKVPECWDIRRLKYVLRERDARSADGSEQLLRVSQFTGVTERKSLDGVDEPDTRAESLVGYKRVEPGELVVNIMLAWNGSMGVSSFPGIASPAYCVYRFGPVAEPWFFHHLLRSPSYKAHIKTASRGVVESRLRLYSDDLYRLEALLPPLPEQAAIVRFLDYMDRRIRRYIRAKQRLMGLLEEQKQAIISTAVTCGIDGTALRSTGDRWFPEVPVDWRVLPMRRVIRSAIDGPHFSPSYVDDGVPFLSARNIKADRWSLDDVKYISRQDHAEFCKRVKPLAGDVLYTKGGTTGVARAVDLDYPFQVWVHVAVLKPEGKIILPDYLAVALNTPRCYEQSQLFTRGATNQDLGLGRMQSIVLPVPPLAEQHEIARFAGAVSEQHASAKRQLQRQVDLMREYRIRLVADVITGKVDVRKATANLPHETEEPETLADEDLLEAVSEFAGAEQEAALEEVEA